MVQGRSRLSLASWLCWSQAPQANTIHLIADGTFKLVSGRTLEWEWPSPLGTLLGKGSAPVLTPGLWALVQNYPIIYSSKRKEKVSSVDQSAPRIL